MRLLYLFVLLATFTVSSCASVKNSVEASGPIDLSKEALSENYGYIEKDPIKVGGVAEGLGPNMERKFLNQLAGPNGEEISYNRTKSCCAFDTPNGMMGQGLLDVYEITYDGLDTPIELYINMYDYEEPRIPVGFTRKK